MSFTKQDPSITSQRYAYIDILRGLAAFIVVVYHSYRAYERAGWSTSYLDEFIIRISADWMNFGKMGVAAFFIVSGFVIPHSLRAGRARPLAVFSVSRVARLYPAYWVSIIFAIATFSLIGENYLSIRSILYNVTMFQQFFGVPNLISIYWTLQIEIIFYFLCAALFAIGWLGNMKIIESIAWAALILALLMAAARGFLNVKLPVAIPLALFLMFLGYIFRSAKIEGDARAIVRALRLSVGFFILLPIISIMAYSTDSGFGESPYSYIGAYLFATIISTYIIFFVNRNNIILSWMGQISYSVYLLHYCVVMLVVEAFGKIGFVPGGLFGLLFFVVVITGAISWFVFRFIEVPFISLGRKISQSISHRSNSTVGDNVV